MAGQKQYEMEYKLSANLAGSFSSTFSKAQNALNETQEKLKALAQEQSDIAAYEKQQAAVEKSAQKLELLQKKLANVSQEYTESGSKSSTLANRMLDYENSIQKTSSALQKQENELREMESALTAAGVDTKNLGSESDRLEREMDQLTEAEKEAQRGAEEFGEAGSASITGVGDALAAAGIAIALKKIYDGFKDVVSVAGDFEAEMSYVEALSGGTGDEMAELTEKAKAMGAATKFTAQESASAFSYMALAGWNTESMLEGIEPVLNLAAAANMDLATASDIVTDYLTAFGLKASDTAGFVDQMAYAMSHSNTDVEQLGEAYKACAATSKSLGYSVEDTTAILMAMANAGVKGGEAGTALNAIMTRLATDTKGCASALEEYGVHVYDTEGNMQSLSSILTGIGGVFENLTDQEQANLAKMIAGTNQYSKFQTIMAGCGQEAIAAGQSFTDYANALENCNGTATKMSDTMLNNMNGQLTIMQSAWEGLTIAVGEDFTPALSKLFGVGSDVLGQITQFVNDNPTLVKALGIEVVAIAAVTGGMTAYALATKAAKDANAAFMASAGISMGPIIALTAGFGLLVAGAVAIKEATEDAIPSVSSMSEAAEATQSAIRDSSGAYDDAVESTEAAAATADMYITRLEELEATGLQTEAQQQEYHNVLQLLCQTVPELSGIIDLQTDSIDGGTQALRDNTAAWKENAMAQAMQEQYQNIMQNYSDTVAEYASNQVEYTKASLAYSKAEESKADAVDRSAKLFDQAQADADAYFEKTGEMADANGFLTSEYYDLQSAISDYDMEMTNSKATMENAKEAMDKDKQAMSDAEAEAQAYKDACEELGFSFDATADSAEDAAAATDKQTDAVKRSYREELKLKYAAQMVADGVMDATQAATAYGLELDTLNGYIDDQDSKQEQLEAALQAVHNGYLNAETAAERFGVSVDDIYVEGVTEAVGRLSRAYSEAYKAAYESLNGQFDLWDKAESVSSTSMSELQSNLESQVTYWNNYNSNLATVAQAAQDAELDISGIWDSLSSGSPEAVAAVQGMAEEITSSSDNGTDALTNYVNTYTELQDAMGQTADTIASNTSEVQDAVTQLTNAVETGLSEADLADKFSQSAEDTINGYIAGLGDGTSVSALLASHATAWLEMFNETLGVHSPSTITQESGENTIEGFINGVDGMTADAISAMGNAANSSISAFKAQMNTTTLYTAGQNAIRGAINGINSMIPSLVAAATSAGHQASQAYKNAQDIHSPSKVFEYFGQMDMMGAIQGIEKNQEKANAAFEAAGLENAAAYQDAVNTQAGYARLYADQNQAVYADIPGVMSQAAQSVNALVDSRGGATIYYSPTYNLSGVGSSNDVRNALNDFDATVRGDLREFIIETMADHTADMDRRVIR